MENIILEGAISVKAALEAGRRECYEIVTDGRKPDRNRNYILNLAKSKGVKITEATPDRISELAGGTSHGGLLAIAGERTYQQIDDLLSHPLPFLALLEGIEDPFNFGGALRSLYAAGVETKASAGASEFLKIAAVSDWDQTLTEIKRHGVRILCAERKNAVSLYESNLTGPLLLVFGGEMRGISAKILRHSDQNVFLPYGSDFRNALSANSAAAVFAFEAYRQRKEH